MEFRDELLLRVEIVNGAKCLCWNGYPLRADRVRAQIEELSEYNSVFAECCFTDAEVTVERLLPENRPFKLTPRREIRGFLERSYRRQALEDLAALGEERVRRDKEFLAMRISAEDGPAALEDFVRLAALPETSPIDLSSALKNLDGADHKKAATAFARWVASHLSQVERWGVSFILSDVAVSCWPLPVLLAACESSFKTRNPSNDFRPWLVQAVKVAPTDPLVVQAQMRAEARERELDAFRRSETASVLASRPNFDDVERLFKVRLPTVLRRTWEDWYAGNRSELRLIHVKAGQLDDLMSTADFMFSEHGSEDLGEDGLKAVPNLPYPALPFADGLQDSDYFALDLSRPLPDGDFPILMVMHDNAEGGVREVAKSSAEWLERGADNWREDDGMV